MLPIILGAGAFVLGYAGKEAATRLFNSGVASLKEKIAGPPPGLTPEDEKKYLKEYADSMDIGENPINKEAFNNYAQNRIKDFSGFSMLKTEDGKTFEERLKQAPNAEAEAEEDSAEAIAGFKQSLQEALKFDEKTTQAQEKFNQELESINQFIMDPDSAYNPDGLVSYLHTVKNDARRAIENEMQAQVDKLSKQFDSEEFRTQLTTSLKINESEIPQIKEQMLSALQDSNKKQLEKFDEEMKKPIDDLHIAAQKRRDEITFIAALYDKNKIMQKEIDRIIEEKRKKGTPEEEQGITIAVDGDKKSALLKGIKLTDLKTFQTVTGLPIQKQDDGFAIQLPNRIISPFYYGGWNSKSQADMVSLVQAAKISGYNVKWVISHKEEKHAIELAQRMYAACREAGTDPKQMKVNGKDMSIDEIFKNSPSKLQAIQSKAETYAKARHEISESVDPKLKCQEFKKSFEEYKTKQAAQQISEEQPPAPTI
ncbi:MULTISPECIES: hypothetical protein [Legionella]|uniref:Coiled coil domain-containing protein n=1 Tax=Legionella septentrionalis TaxID=2498109 RepID=A0A433JKE6_9GAMM|nr:MULTISPECIES: hypothetical protein [Legionella]MCP0914197.1 hypothetical protein [Legionella sp. 27cVA30]RUQ89227.1 hypothetical protein EKM59_03875 [Legionella septentrionalis]RUR00538.1 hypothetical protein ELY11_01935 [Legionella septentrionalis]RUR11739.1 hypothetical protein ELY14_00395 [Legionella septentrionalis]